MPTNTNSYNSRVTDEALEKRFRDTFRAQGGAELVDDLYAQGVIVPVVDFTAAATGQQLAENLQTAWDFSTGSNQVRNATTTLISNAGFWSVDLNVTCTGSTSGDALVYLSDGVTNKNVFVLSNVATNTDRHTTTSDKFVVFIKSGDSLAANSNSADVVIDIWYKQIATVNGDLVNPSGFTSS